MTLSASPPRPDVRALLLPGLTLRVGDMLGGRYRLESLVNADRALVHLAAEIAAKHTKADVFVLVGDEINDAVRLKFLAEARKTASLSSTHAARVLHVGVTSDGHPFVVQERLPEQTLASLLEGGHSLEAEHAVDIALDVCDALLEAHSLDVSHGELGTHSVHLDWENDRPTNVKLVGLATARVLATLPIDASTLGPPVMRAPELLANRAAPATVLSDVWGLGVLLYTMLAGAPPFMADTPSAVSVSVTSEEQASLAGVPDAVAELVDACLSKDPANRPQTIRDVADRLLPHASKPAESLARIVARVTAPQPKARTSLAPAPDMLAVTAAMPAAQIPPAALPTQRAIPAAMKTPIDELDVTDVTARYARSELERLQKEAQPRESELAIDVEFGASTRDVSAAAGVDPKTVSTKSLKAAAKAEVDDDEEKSATTSAPPVAITIPPPASERAITVARESDAKLAEARKADAASDAKLAVAKAAQEEKTVVKARPVGQTLPKPKSNAKVGGAMMAAACLAAGIVVGILVPRAGKQAARPAPVENVQVAAEPPAAPVELSTATLPGPVAPAATAEAAPATPTVAATDLAPAKPVAKAAAPAAKPAPVPATKARAQSAPAARPETAPAAAPAKPETKAHDDDLRRFLDDRR